MQIYRTVVGNTSPGLLITCERNGTVIDVTGATVSLIIRNERTGITSNTGHQSCSLTTPTLGLVTYLPQANDFPSEDRYIGDLKIVNANTTTEYLFEEVLVIARGAVS